MNGRFDWLGDPYVIALAALAAGLARTALATPPKTKAPHPARCHACAGEAPSARATRDAALVATGSIDPAPDSG